jgi:hypothetical protein
VRFFEGPVALDNTPGDTPRQLHASAVGMLVSLPIPAGVGRERLEAEFQAALPTYRQVPGLLIKAFTLSDDGRFGGLYLWQDAASAERWFNAGWQQRARERHGAEPRIEWFDTPMLLPSRLATNQLTVPGWAAAHQTRSKRRRPPNPRPRRWRLRRGAAAQRRRRPAADPRNGRPAVRRAGRSARGRLRWRKDDEP